MFIVTDVFDYNPDAPAGQKIKVLAASPNQRFYHSVAMLIPDGRIIVCGTDQATYVTGWTAYSHMAEAFTPPWLLDGTPRPVVERYGCFAHIKLINLSQFVG